MKSALTIGNFDGVHRGHRVLLETIGEWKRSHLPQSKLQTVVLTFDPHPIEVLRAPAVVKRLCSTSEKITMLQRLGADFVKVIPFTDEFSKMSAEDFFKDVLIRDLNVSHLAIGQNFHFGHNREGSPGKVIDWCNKSGIKAQIVPGIESDGELISSSRIRKLIEGGQLVAASRLLGRDYSLTGEVLHGDKRGQQLGFPTANMVFQNEGMGARCLPGRGVYLSVSTVEDKTYPSITNVGVKPTVSNLGKLVVETHLLDFKGDLYGKLLSVEFRDRLRDEQRFASFNELQLQIQKDIELARSRLTIR